MIISTFLAIYLLICIILDPILEINFPNVKIDEDYGQNSCLFVIIVDLTSLGFLLILYNLGTTKMKERERSEASNGASTRFTVNDELERDDSNPMMFLEPDLEVP